MPQLNRAAQIADAEQNRIFLDPVLHGRYPAKARRAPARPPQSLIRDGDMELANAPIDFLGVNYYSPHYVKLADPAGPLADETPMFDMPDVVMYKPVHLPRTSMGG